MYQSQNAHWFTYLCQLQKVFSMENALLPWVLHVNNDKKKTSNYLLSFMDVVTLACMKLDAFEKLVWLSFLIFIPPTDQNHFFCYLRLDLNECMLCRYRVSVLCLLEQYLK